MINVRRRRQIVDGSIPTPRELREACDTGDFPWRAESCDDRSTIRLIGPDGRGILYSAEELRKWPALEARLGIHAPGAEYEIVKLHGDMIAVLPQPAINGPAAAAKPTTHERSWFDLASFFLSRDIREVVRGDICERRTEMAARGYGRIWINLMTAHELGRSLMGSWTGLLVDLFRKVLL